MFRIVIVVLLSLSFCKNLFSQQTNNEFRANWVITWEYISSSSSVDQNKAKIRQILDDHKAGHFNSVLWQVRQSGTAYYNSSYEPYGSYAGGAYPGFDPMAYAIEEAHKRGLEFHAWFNVFHASSTVPGTPAQQHPEWICRDQDGNPMTSSIALSPGLKAVRDYTKNVAMEIVRNYDIDGLHLDYIRWNEYTSSTTSKEFEKLQTENNLLDGDITVEQIEELADNLAGRYLYDIEHPYSAGIPSGFATWEDWWRWSVTEFVKTLHDSIQAVKPYVRLSVAALGKYNWSGWNGYYVVYQDAALWFNEGYIEQIAGMHYHWTTGSGFYGMLVGACPECWSQFIQPGIAAKRFYTVGPPSYVLNDNNIWNNHVEIVNSCRTVNWVDGFQFFSYNSWKDRDYWNEAASTFFSRKTKIRDANLHLDTIPASPQLSIQKIDSLNYRLTITPDASTSINQWFAIYRSPDDNFDLNTDEIIAITFGDSQFTIDEVFTGNQDFNSNYRYAATMLDRYWNESLISNIVLTDSIPSYAPKVSSSTPLNGDTISVSTQIKITFSKTMNTSSLTGAVRFSPLVSINNITFSDGNKTITLTTGSNFSFQTEYTLTIDSTVTDVNGKMLDGNGDGISGDSYVLSFSTVAQDLSGPIVMQTFPDSLTSGSFDVDGVLTVMFDELVNPATINNDNVILKTGTTQISKGMQLKTIGNQSILNLKTQQPLLNNTQYSLTLTQNITDVIGNQMLSDQEFFFSTSDLAYSHKVSIDDFSTTGNWQQPEYSGSTVGIVDSGTSSGYTSSYYLPASPANGFFIQYQWDPAITSKLIREYLSGGAPRNVIFDTSNILQVYVWGDGSYNKFRFAIDEGDGTNWPNHEVSKWTVIDWYGWRLVEWNLKDPSSVGTWIGNGVLDYPKYRVDSFQMTDAPGSLVYGRIYVDNLRLAKKSIVSRIEMDEPNNPNDFVLYQNYPNPFNPSTKIKFTIPSVGTQRAVSVQLKVYDVLGKEVTNLIDEEHSPGNYEVIFDTTDMQLSSGIYFYQLKADNLMQTKKMMLLR
jgi:uncharacterized lipoprotein YddW (UPF0748 family)